MMTEAESLRKYEWKIVIVFFFAWGFVFLDRLAIAYLTPTLVEVFNLSNAQVGKIGTVTTGCYAVATIFFSMLAHRVGKPKKTLVAFVMATAVAACLCALVQTYTQLLLARGLVGAFEGPILPLIMVLVSKTAGEKSLGLDSGIINLGVVILAIMLGPLLVTQVLAISTWQMAFLLAALPSCVVGILIMILVKEAGIQHPPESKSLKTNHARNGLLPEFLNYRNIRVCSLVSIVAMSGYWCIMLYAPLYLTRVNHTSIRTMGFISSAMGVTMIVYAILIPKLSDIFRRKPILTLFLVFPAVGTSLMAIFPGTGLSMLAYVTTGGILGCLMPVYAIIIPLESVPDHLKASANSFVIGLGEIIGGAFFPWIAGTVADAIGMPAMMGLASALLGAGILVSLFVTEPTPAQGIDQAVMPLPGPAISE
jgi:MFS family permease